MSKFEVSVVIPVYNADKFLEESIESVIGNPHVEEILLVNDGSRDSSRKICLDFESKYKFIRLIEHPGGLNKGVSATRNLGMKQARYEFISFLDADDVFVPNRFKETYRVFKDNQDVDGVYEAIGIFRQGNIENYKLYSINKKIDTDKLFHYLIRGTYGHFSTDGITFRKSLLKRSGYFNSNLVLHEDSELWLRMAHYGKLLPGNIETPVALARRHGNNTITGTSKASNIKFWRIVKEYFKDKKISFLDRSLINYKLALHQSNSKLALFMNFIKNTVS